MIQKINLSSELRKFIVNWDNNFPIDFLWRQKHGIRFGSEEHKKADFITMVIEFEEAKFVSEMIKAKQDRIEEAENGAIPGLERLKHREQKMSKKEVDDEYDSIDLNQYNNPTT